MRILTCTCIAGLVLALAGCSDTSTTTKTATITNADLEQQVKAQLSADQLLGPAISVSADADKNQVTLSGTVWTEGMRSQAVNLAQAARPGLTVVDKIDVNPAEMPKTAYTETMSQQAREKAEAAGEKIGKSLDDAWAHTKIVAKLIGNDQTQARKISVDVVDQVVTLRGEVESTRAKEEASRIALSTDGVKRVTNLLKVHPNEKKS
jgi:osmotically-inducible protein OsmY